MKPDKTDATRRMFGHLQEAAKALAAGNVDQMRMSELVLTGMLDLDVREPRHQRLVRNMLRELALKLRPPRKK